MPRKIGGILLIALMVVMIGGCMFNKPTGKLLLVGIERVDDYWSVTFRNPGWDSVQVSGAIFVAYDHSGNQLASRIGPNGSDGRPFEGLDVYGQYSSEVNVYYLKRNKTATANLFAGIDGIHKIAIQIGWRVATKNSYPKLLDTTITVGE